MLPCWSAPAATLLVWPDSPSPGAPFTNWSAAAHKIQDAVDTAQAGDTILVTNGVYATGGRAVYGRLTNRVAVTKPVTVQSVNGPGVTVIQGSQERAHTNGDGAIRCVYLADGAVLNGFTLARGATRASGDTTLEKSGGGVWCASTNALVTNCVLFGNWAAASGGGAYAGTLKNCILTGNWAQLGGGGACNGTRNTCVFTANSAAGPGGGVYNDTLSNCTLTGNSASSAGGAYLGSLNNCILYYNQAPNGPNYSGSTLNYCCTTPAPGSGSGNLTTNPQLVDSLHLNFSSPCRGAGSAAYATGLDIDGEVWLNPPSIGCDDYRAGSVTGPLTVTIVASWTNVTPGVEVDLTVLVSGRVTATVWDFGDGMVLSNQFYVRHAWSAVGDYAVVLLAYNDSHPEGVGAWVTIRVMAPEVHYVSAASTNPTPPYVSWNSAAQTIQDAVDAAVPGALIWVGNGVYATGGRAVLGLMTNRVVVAKPVTVRSVSGPARTHIQGYQVPGTTWGDGAVRCVYLTDGAVLSGFTLANGATRAVGDATSEESGGGVWCDSTNAWVTHCVFTGNWAPTGGGAFSGTLSNCVLTGNVASYGGGACQSAVNNCVMTGNSARWEGGGAYGGTLNNCALTGNSAGYFGGGARFSTLNNCTLTGNSALSNGGGVDRSALNNCILCYNQCGNGYFDNYSSDSTLKNCCATPLPGGSGNIAAEPRFLDLPNGNLRLHSNSPCINAGANDFASGATDLDSRSRIFGGRVDIGAYEYHGPLYVSATSTNPMLPYSSWATAARTIQEAVDTAVPGDEIVVTNGVYAAGGRAVHGTMTNRVALTTPATLRSVNGPEVTWIQGDEVPGSTNGGGAIRCVYLTNGTVLHGFTLTNGATHAAGDQTREQSGGGVWCESTNARVVNCTIQGNAAQAAGGGAWSGTLEGCALTGNTAATGGGTAATLLNRCTLRGNTATTGGGVSGGTLRGCMLAGNAAATAGGGADSAMLYDCVLTNNRATVGGGASRGTLDRCVLSGNAASSTGGGADSGTLHNCLLTSNVAQEGGGVASCALNNCTLTCNAASVAGGGAFAGTLTNCILYYNAAPGGSNYASNALSYCCTTPDPGRGPGNLISEPLFVDRLNGNLRLQTNSPCLNAGAKGSVSGTTDLDGRPRVVGGTVDLGAYEVQDATTNRFVAWLSQHGFPIQVWSDSADPDGDGRNNWQEWVADTNPTNALSLLRLFPLTGGASGVVVTWQSLTNRTYSVERSTNLGASPPFHTLAAGLPGQAGTTSYTDTNTPTARPAFYRIRTQP